MKVADAAGFWAFEPSLVDEADLVECPEDDVYDGCAESSPLSEWYESAVYCELCGDHAALVCPQCGEHFDHVNGPVFGVTPAAG